MKDEATVTHGPDWDAIRHRLRQVPAYVKDRIALRLTTMGEADKRMALDVLAEFEAKRDTAKVAANIAVFRFEARVQSGEFSDPNGTEAREALIEIIAGAVVEAEAAEDRRVVQRFLGLEAECEALPPEVKARYPWPGTRQQ